MKNIPTTKTALFFLKTQKENRAAILSLLENRCSVFALIMSFKDVLLQVFSQVKVIG
jgi:hypothetical protein